jgi:hypothetical protein
MSLLFGASPEGQDGKYPVRFDLTHLRFVMLMHSTLTTRARVAQLQGHRPCAFVTIPFYLSGIPRRRKLGRLLIFTEFSY